MHSTVLSVVVLSVVNIYMLQALGHRLSGVQCHECGVLRIGDSRFEVPAKGSDNGANVTQNNALNMFKT